MKYNGNKMQMGGHITGGLTQWRQYQRRKRIATLQKKLICN